MYHYTILYIYLFCIFFVYPGKYKLHKDRYFAVFLTAVSPVPTIVPAWNIVGA